MKLFIAYYRTDSGEMDAECFVGDETKDTDKQFIEFFKRENGGEMLPEDLMGTYEFTPCDCNGNQYKIKLEKI